MKEVMRKISVLSYYEDRGEITEFLQDLGIIHIIPGELSGSADELENRLYKLDKIIELVSKGAKTSGRLPVGTIDEMIDQVEKAHLENERLLLKFQSVQQKMDKIRQWGDFDREKYRYIQNRGCEYFFYTIQEKQLDKLDLSAYTYVRLKKERGLIYMVFLAREPDDELRIFFNRDEIPTESSQEVERELQDLTIKIQANNDLITEYSGALDLFIRERTMTSDQLALQKAVDSHVMKEKIAVLEGWFPRRNEKELVSALSDRGLTYIIDQPRKGDDVPVLLRNNRYSRLFEPITQIFQLPDYYELDLTPVIAVFYPIFFAYCLGDAGYGILVLLIAAIGWFTFLKSNRQLAVLVFLLGGFTTVMGIIKSGSVFGIPMSVDSEIPLFSFLAGFILIPDDQDYIFNAFNVALMFGVLQVIVGIIASIVNRAIYFSLKEALPQVGKFLIVTAIIVLFLVRMQDVDVLKPYEHISLVSLYAGIGMVLLFHDMTIPLLSRIGSGVLPLFFIFTGILGDILSYVRLFALGVASAVLGLVINQIGMQIMDGQWWNILLGILFLVFGHGLNLALAVLGAFVHPLRLTFVEFYNNAGFSGGGKPFKPLKKEINN